ncbi:hypothetical protein Tco_1086252 [Tanacetum coccineum]
MSTCLVNRSSSSAIGFKTPVDMLGFFDWLSSIKQGMFEPVKVKGIFLGYHKGIVGNKLWRLDDVTSKVLGGVEFEVEPQEDHTFEVEPHGNVDHVAGLKDDMDSRLDVYVLSNGCKKCNDDNDGYYWEYTLAKGNILGWEIIRDQSRNTLRVSQSRIYNEKLVQTLLKRHSTLSLEDSLSMDCDVEKNASAGVDMLDGFDRGLQTNHMEALSTAKAGYAMFTEAWKKEIWLKGLLSESRYELRLVAGIATGALVKSCSRSEVPV